MYYIEKNEKEVVKYKVHLYEERLNEIRDILINKYSSTININNFFCFSNIKELETDKIKNYNNNTLKVDFSYYIYPELVILIDMLITGNLASIEKIVNYKQRKIILDEFHNENFLKNVCLNLSNELNVEFTIKDLLYYLDNKNYTYINNKEHEYLKEEILKCISFERVNAISINEFYKMIDFLNLNTSDVLNNYSKKVKTKINK